MNPQIGFWALWDVLFVRHWRQWMLLFLILMSILLFSRVQQFFTREPKLVFSSLEDGQTEVVLQPDIVFVFDTNLDAGFVKESLEIRPAVSFEVILAQKNWLGQPREVRLLFLEGLEEDQEYELFMKSPQAWWGGEGQEVYRKFSTVSRPRIIDTFPRNGMTDVREDSPDILLYMSKAISSQGVNYSINPFVKSELSFNKDGDLARIKLLEVLEQGVTYRVDVFPGQEEEPLLKIEEGYEFSFLTRVKPIEEVQEEVQDVVDENYQGYMEEFIKSDPRLSLINALPYETESWRIIYLAPTDIFVIYLLQPPADNSQAQALNWLRDQGYVPEVEELVVMPL